MNTSLTVSFYWVPYNGKVSICRLRRNGRLVNQVVTWHSLHQDDPAERTIEVPLGLSKVDLLAGIYYFGTSIIGRTKARIEKEASRGFPENLESLSFERFELPRTVRVGHDVI